MNPETKNSTGLRSLIVSVALSAALLVSCAENAGAPQLPDQPINTDGADTELLEGYESSSFALAISAEALDALGDGQVVEICAQPYICEDPEAEEPVVGMEAGPQECITIDPDAPWIFFDFFLDPGWYMNRAWIQRTDGSPIEECSEVWTEPYEIEMHYDNFVEIDLVCMDPTQGEYSGTGVQATTVTPVPSTVRITGVHGDNWWTDRCNTFGFELTAEDTEGAPLTWSMEVLGAPATLAGEYVALQDNGDGTAHLFMKSMGLYEVKVRAQAPSGSFDFQYLHPEVKLENPECQDYSLTCDLPVQVPLVGLDGTGGSLIYEGLECGDGAVLGAAWEVGVTFTAPQDGDYTFHSTDPMSQMAVLLGDTDAVSITQASCLAGSTGADDVTVSLVSGDTVVVLLEQGALEDMTTLSVACPAPGL